MEKQRTRTKWNVSHREDEYGQDIFTIRKNPYKIILEKLMLGGSNIKLYKNNIELSKKSSFTFEGGKRAVEYFKKNAEEIGKEYEDEINERRREVSMIKKSL